MPSTSDKQRRYMGMQLAKERKTGHNDTGMSEKQLSEFASDVKHSHTKKDVPGQSLVDVEHIHQDRHMGSVRARVTDANTKFANPNGQPYMGEEIPVKYLGPDTSYQCVEINVDCYGRDWEPMPMNTLSDPVDSSPWRRREQYEYDSSATMGAQPDRFEYQRRWARDEDPEVRVDAGDMSNTDMYTSDTERVYGLRKHERNA